MSLLADLADAVGPDNLITAPAALRTYETDGLASHRAIPHAVVLPTSTAQVAAAVRACRSATFRKKAGYWSDFTNANRASSPT